VSFIVVVITGVAVIVILAVDMMIVIAAVVLVVVVVSTVGVVIMRVVVPTVLVIMVLAVHLLLGVDEGIDAENEDADAPCENEVVEVRGEVFPYSGGVIKIQ